MPDPIVIVGASLAGATAALALREEGYDGALLLVGAEDQPPYERPPLSKEFLRGEAPAEAALVRPYAAWQEAQVDLILGTRATALDPRNRTIELGGARAVRYASLLLATGGRNRTLQAPGAGIAGIHQLRTLDDAEAILADARSATRAVVVGMGFIGAEVAAALRHHGVEVTAIEGASAPLQRVLGAQVGGAIAAIHGDHGVSMVFEDIVESFEGGARVEAVVTKAGRRIPCDMVVAGIGIEPATELAERAGIETNNGILVDALCRTSADGVFAAGDVANHEHPLFGRRVRVEHWQNAIKQGQAAARSMLGKGEPYADVHWFWSDQYEDNIQYAGSHTAHDELIVRGSVADRKFSAFYLAEGRLLACAAINRGRDVRAAQRIIAAGGAVDAAALRDEDIDLRTLAPR